eukprot:351035-Chlamydomonas_euryale.AAC.1
MWTFGCYIAAATLRRQLGAGAALAAAEGATAEPPVPPRKGIVWAIGRKAPSTRRLRCAWWGDAAAHAHPQRCEAHAPRTRGQDA